MKTQTEGTPYGQITRLVESGTIEEGEVVEVVGTLQIPTGVVLQTKGVLRVGSSEAPERGD